MTTSSKRAPRCVVVGLGGYGLVHIDAVRWLSERGLATLSGVVALEVDRKARPALTGELHRQGVRLYDSVEQFLASGDEADVLTVPVGIHMHVPMSIMAMRAGLDVYCEKPVAGTVQEVDQLIAVQHETGRTVAIGFQHIWSRSIQELKARILDGRLGAVRSASLICGWPRSIQYYTRNEWTGRLRVGPHWILDSPANNAHAHYVMNSLYLCGDRPGTAGVPVRVRAELYRANPIEGPDTVQLKCELPSGAAIHLCLTHANATPFGPSLELHCERGTVTWEGDIGKTVVRYASGHREEFDNLSHEKWRFDGFADFADALRKGREPLCTPALARAQTVTINAMHESCPEIFEIPQEEIEVVEDWEMFPPETKGTFHRVRNLDEDLRTALARGAFLSELGIAWARDRRGEWFPLTNYRVYPSRERAAFPQ
jgi:predicted dehydrogenase